VPIRTIRIFKLSKYNALHLSEETVTSAKLQDFWHEARKTMCTTACARDVS